MAQGFGRLGAGAAAQFRGLRNMQEAVRLAFTMADCSLKPAWCILELAGQASHQRRIQLAWLCSNIEAGLSCVSQLAADCKARPSIQAQSRPFWLALRRVQTRS